MKGTCVFCQRVDKLTREHKFPKWVRGEMPAQPKKHHTRDTHTVFDGQQMQRSFSNEHWVKRPLIDVQLPIVCGPCNNGWMSRLQTAMQPIMVPMIRGEQVALDEHSRGIAAAWMAMATMVGEYSSQLTMAIPQRDRTALYQHREHQIPLDLPGWQIALGRYVGRELDNPAHRRYRYWLKPKVWCQATTFRFGELLLVADSGVDQLDGLIDMLADASHHGTLCRIYPALLPSSWPPDLWVHDLIAEDVIFRVRKALAQGVREGIPSIVIAGQRLARDRLGMAE
jgi:hypothetical protein